MTAGCRHPPPLAPRPSPLARGAGVSERTLRREFRRWVGLGPKAVLSMARAREATQQFARGLPPAKVAVAVGCADQAHLTRELKTFFSVTPCELVKRPVLAEFFNP